MLKSWNEKRRAKKVQRIKFAASAYLQRLKNSYESLCGVSHSRGWGGGETGETLTVEEIREILKRELETRADS